MPKKSYFPLRVVAFLVSMWCATVRPPECGFIASPRERGSVVSLFFSDTTFSSRS